MAPPQTKAAKLNSDHLDQNGEYKREKSRTITEAMVCNSGMDKQVDSRYSTNIGASGFWI